VVTHDELTHLQQTDGAVDQRFSVEMLATLDRWLDMADGKLRGGDIPCLVNGGNDDIFEIDEVIGASPCVGIGFSLYEWLSNDLYAVNKPSSLIYMACMYLLAIVIYVTARVVRRRQGVDLSLINKEIPVE
jgi:hypothetical protein